MASVKDSRRNKRAVNGAVSDGGKATTLSEIDILMQDAIAGIPAAKKRSLLLPEDRENDELLEDQAIDFEKEKIRSQEKQHRENLKNKSDAESQEQNSNLLTGLSAAELENHYSQCIQLCNRNKVNVKNAFKLQLIDYMKLIFANQSKKTENLALMGFTLDASAKIYSYRVDKVYTDMMKIMSGKFFKEAENDEKETEGSGGDSQDENEDREDGEPEMAKKKKGKNKKFDDDDELDFTKMTSSEAELRKTQNDNEGLLKARITLPSHQEFFLECPMSGPNGLYVLNKPLFDAEEEEDEEASSNYITLGGNRVTDYEGSIAISDYLPAYKDMHKNFFVVGEMDETQVQNRALVYDSTLEKDDFAERMRAYNDDDLCPDVVEAVADYDDGFSDDEHDIPMLSNNPSLLNSTKSSYSIKGLSSLVTVNDNEFSFFDSGKLNTLAGPTHWHVKRRKLANAPAPVPGTTRKDNTKKNASVDLLNDVLSPKLALLEEQDKPMSLARKTVKTWTRDKNRTVPNTFKMNKFLSMMTNKNLFMSKTWREGSSSKDACPEGGLEVRTLVSSVNPDVEGLDVSDFGNDHACLSPGRRDDDECEHRNSDGTGASDLQLLPAPPRVNKINMNYAKKQKKVDIKLLKNSIWNLMDLEKGERADADEHQDNSEKKVTFSEVFRNVPKHLPPEEADQLSPGIVFMAILHMANEKNLCLSQESEEFTIALG